jgi:hypothetical protein
MCLKISPPLLDSMVLLGASLILDRTGDHRGVVKVSTKQMLGKRTMIPHTALITGM